MLGLLVLAWARVERFASVAVVAADRESFNRVRREMD